MGIPEAYTGLHRAPGESRSWGIFTSEYTKSSDYQAILGDVPLWGQGLLLDLQDYHPDSFNHSLRVATMVREILTVEREGREERKDLLATIPDDKIILAALLHDVGKQDVPIEVLNSSGKPTTEQWQKIRQHIDSGFEAVKSHDLEIAQIVGGHHMHQGGRSYGYEGAKEVKPDITASRVLVAAADVADALGSRRAYKSEIPAERVREIMMGERNFHPSLIDKVVTARFYGSAPFATSVPPQQFRV